MAMEARRTSANFEPSVWDDKYIQSLTTSYLGEKCVAETEKLKTQVKLTTDEAEDEPAQLELIDNLQRLDLCSRFKDRIAKILVKIYEAEKSSGDEDECMKKDLHLTSLKFRLLRQHGFHVPQEVFCSFMDELGNFKDCAAEDVRGLISLYEASFLSMEGESILDLAKDFSSNYLTRKLEDVGVAEEVKHALELLLHWRMQKLEALWFIKVYQNRSDANTHLLQLSKLDFNMVQATHQHELKRVSRWDINSLDRLPEYKRISFLALFNFANELGYHILSDQGFNVISHLRRLVELPFMATEARRSANYEPSIWDDKYIQSLTTSYSGEKYVAEAEKLKTQVKLTIDEAEDEVAQLELIDSLQRLDLCSHFKDSIAKILLKIYEAEKSSGDDDECMKKDLHLTSLKFRLLRQHGFHVPQEVFCSFMDGVGNFKDCVAEDVRGLISLYEASFLSMEGESVLDLAKDFSSNHLTRKLEEIEDGGVAEEVKHALELPLHWRMQKLEALWFIKVYQNRSDANTHLVQLAKLDFNMVQATYQNELKRVSSWYRETGLPEKLNFARHRLAECFMWAMGFIPEAHLGKSREILTKIAVLITIIDDIHDVYGTLDELHLFTDTIERWDINSLDRLPEYMQICFLALFNSANELAYHILRDQGFNAISNLRRLWGELSRAYYLEALWFHSGYFPTTNEYLNIAWVSISGPLLLFHGYFSTTDSINKDELQRMEQHSGLIRWPSMVLRLADDLGTSSDEIKRGDVPKSIQCIMNDTGCCEEEARKQVKELIEVALKGMNKEILMEKPLKDFGETAMNLGRISLFMYQHGDGFGLPHAETKKNLVSLLVRPIPML